MLPEVFGRRYCFAQKEYYNYPKKKPVVIILGICALVAIFFVCQTILTLVAHVIDKNADAMGTTDMILMGLGNLLAAVVLWLFFMRILLRQWRRRFMCCIDFGKSHVYNLSCF